ncbi:MAG: PatB family C-S lyase [Muribaculaceae bacterium]|nr:PatB family C-S lyase [Muribaculaceae bacterium]
MTKYNFDRLIDRHGTCAVKYEGLDQMFGRHDVTPLWIADLDFAVCPDITAALLHRLEHPVLGYSAAPDSYWDSIIDWQNRRHGMKVAREELAFIPGVVKGIALAVNYFTSRGDAVAIQPPVYHPFRAVIEGNGRVVAENPLLFDGKNYTMDIDGLRRVIAETKPKLMILCNPHNPIGLQWSRETLAEVGRICSEAGVTVVSDEIHGDLMLGGRKHIPFCDASDDCRRCGVMLGAPSKTFNIPGLVSSWMVIKNPELRRDFYHWLEVNEFSAPVLISTIGAEAAYTHGEAWLNEMLAYIESNIEFTEQFLERELPQVRMVRPEASFLVWLDFTDLHLDQPRLMDMLISEAHVALNDGAMFGRQGSGFARLNVGTPRAVLADALAHIADAVRHHVTPTAL